MTFVLRSFCAAVALLGICFVASVGVAGPVTSVTPLGAQSLLSSDGRVRVLDIRTPAEFRTGHLKGALNVDFYNRNFRARLAELDRDATYLVHCRRGTRSGASMEAFKELGFKRVIHMPAGMDGWKRAGLPLVK